MESFKNQKEIMARIRYLKPEFFTDEDLADIPFQTRLTFAGLWCYADREGRLEDRPKYLKAMIFPYDNVDMEKQLQTLAQPKHGNGNPFIIRYEIESKRFIEILSWEYHQKPHHTEVESKIPPAPPLREDKDKDKEKCPSDKLELSNVSKTVKTRLKITEHYNSPLFIGFWNCYPRKEAKGKAWEEWLKIRPLVDEKIVEQMKSRIEHFRNTPQWQKEDGQFIPLPSTWLHQRRWEDEIDGRGPGSVLDPVERLKETLRKDKERKLAGGGDKTAPGEAPSGS